MRFPCVHAAATTPVQQLGVVLAQSHPAVSAFPERGIGSACTSSFSRIARRSLTLRPAHSRGHLFVTRLRRPASKCRVKAFCNANGGCSGEGAYPQALSEADHDGSYAFRRLGRPQEDDFGGAGRCGGERDGTVLRHDREYTGYPARAMQEAIEGRAGSCTSATKLVLAGMACSVS